MSTQLSVIIPNHNGSAFVETCLKALFSARHQPFEVIVIDDFSSDCSVEMINNFPCRLIRLEKQGGASKARNIGAQNSLGNALFFIDVDCVVQNDTILHAINAYEKNRDLVIGGSYTPIAFDDTFFSTFQSIFINYSELRKIEPDYIAAHAMVIGKDVFEKSGGFTEDFMPIIEDVEFSHRLKRSGQRLIMDKAILVRHIFNYDLRKSVRNAFRKSRYWIGYSMGNRDMMADSGTASVELKFTVLCSCLIWLLFLCLIIAPGIFFLACMIIVFTIDFAVSRSLIRAFFREKGLAFGIMATLYYSVIYPLAVAAGGASGIAYYLQSQRKRA
ncbi:MAG: glycosyltransferase [Nitrospirota bacterium]|nr:glycosyltransferase [Nitrospirota bacterium]